MLVFIEGTLKQPEKAKSMLGFIEGTLKQPEKPAGQGFLKADAWDMVKFNVIDPKLRLNVAYIDTTHEIWEELKKKYLVVNISKIHQLKVAIVNCKQGHIDVGDFYNKLIDFME